MKEKVLFWRTVTKSDDFSAEFDAAEVEFVEFDSEEVFDDTTDIYEIPSACICYNPSCSERRYKDEAGRIYARCLAVDVAGDIADQLKQCSQEKIAEALANPEKYICESGYVTRGGETIVFAGAPLWWREQCARWLADCFDDEGYDDDE